MDPTNLFNLDGLEVGSPNLYGTFVGPQNAPLLANLGPIQNNGGIALTMVPLEDSLAIDPVGGDTTSDFTTDQRGASRIVGGVLDIGAVEAPDYAAIRAALLSQLSQLNRKVKRLQRKIKKLRRNGRITPIKRLKGKIRKFKKEIRIIQQELSA